MDDIQWARLVRNPNPFMETDDQINGYDVGLFRLSELKAHILDHPEELNMCVWYSNTGEHFVGCIAAHICRLNERFRRVDSDPMTIKASEILGVGEIRARNLFYLVFWPDKYREAYYRAEISIEKAIRPANELITL